MALLRIEIKSPTVGEQEIKPSGKPDAKVFEPFTKRQQTAYVTGLVDRNGSPEPFPVRINIDLGTKKEPRPALAVGVYDISPESFFVDRFDNLVLGRLTLTPVQAALKAA